MFNNIDLHPLDYCKQKLSQKRQTEELLKSFALLKA